MRVSIIAAIAENGVIGLHGNLPWQIPEDLKYFKKITMGAAIIMGRKTFESIGKPLPGRTNIVITRNQNFIFENADIAYDLESSIKIANRESFKNNINEMFIIGGAQIYSLALEKTDRLYITEIHSEVKGDTWFPILDNNAWTEISRKRFKSKKINEPEYSFVIHDRKQ